MSGEKHAPELPVIVDEAGDSAPWVAPVGILLFIVLAIVFVVKVFGTEPTPAAAADAQGTTAAAATDAP